MITGKGLVDVAGNTILGEEYEKEGLAGVVKKKATGAAGADKGLVEGVTDAAMGEGTYQKIGDTADQVVDSVGNGVRAARDAAGNLISGAAGSCSGYGWRWSAAADVCRSEYRLYPPADNDEWRCKSVYGHVQQRSSDDR